MPPWVWRIIIGLLITALGVLMAYKTPWFLRMMGRVAWAERTFGGGGTRLFYKLLGTLIAIIGIMVTTDLFSRFMEWLVGGLFG